MTLTLEIAPEIEAALEARARRAGVPVTDYAVRVLARDTEESPEARSAAPDANAAFLALTKKLIPEIEAGTIARPGTTGPTALLDDLRDERDAELTGALRRAA